MHGEIHSTMCEPKRVRITSDQLFVYKGIDRQYKQCRRQLDVFRTLFKAHTLQHIHTYIKDCVRSRAILKQKSINSFEHSLHYATRPATGDVCHSTPGRRTSITLYTLYARLPQYTKKAYKYNTVHLICTLSIGHQEGVQVVHCTPYMHACHSTPRRCTSITLYSLYARLSQYNKRAYS